MNAQLDTQFAQLESSKTPLQDLIGIFAENFEKTKSFSLKNMATTLIQPYFLKKEDGTYDVMAAVYFKKTENNAEAIPYHAEVVFIQDAKQAFEIDNYAALTPVKPGKEPARQTLAPRPKIDTTSWMKQHRFG